MATIIERLKALGFKNYKERTAWLEEHKEEIKEFRQHHTLEETRQHFHTGLNTMKRLGLTMPRKGKEKVATGKTNLTPEKLIETLPPDADVGYLIAKGLFDRIKTLAEQLSNVQAEVSELKKQLTEQQAENKALGEQLAGAEKEKKTIMESCNEALARAKLPKFTLDDLKHAMGKGPDGTRRSFVP